MVLSNEIEVSRIFPFCPARLRYSPVKLDDGRSFFFSYNDGHLLLHAIACITREQRQLQLARAASHAELTPRQGPGMRLPVIVPSLLPVCWPECSGNSIIHGHRRINSVSWGLLINKPNVSFIEDLQDKHICHSTTPTKFLLFYRNNHNQMLHTFLYTYRSKTELWLSSITPCLTHSFVEKIVAFELLKSWVH